jgi:predicted metal-dependent hydrolase
MRLIKVSKDEIVFRISPAEKEALFQILNLYPLVPTSHHRLTRGDQIPNKAANQQFLEEMLEDQRAENRKLLSDLFGNPNKIVATGKGMCLRLSRPEIEWMLQITNDIRVGSWIALGSPDLEANPALREQIKEPTPDLIHMNVAGQLEMILLDALSRDGLEHESEYVETSSGKLPLKIIRNPRARRYSLRLLRDGTVRLTMPEQGSKHEATLFLEKNLGWIEKQYQRILSLPERTTNWAAGTKIWFRGEQTVIEQLQPGVIRIGKIEIGVKTETTDFRHAIERHLRILAARELPLRLAELAAVNKLSPGKITVRNQRTRWGSCSRQGNISLNWRLIQTPEFVRDYIMLHELAHLRHMNHSVKYWEEVRRLCPGYLDAEKWLKENRGLLR